MDPTPRELGFTMPAEWTPHTATLMAWPRNLPYWEGRVDQARDEYAGIARLLASFEPVIMVTHPGDESSVRDRCGTDVEILPIPINDSWIRDSGPIFVRDEAGEVAAVDFGFNAWGERLPSWDLDDAMARAVATHLGVRTFEAPMVLEGGAILTDGEGTLITTEMCLLNPNRNKELSKEQMETILRDFLGMEKIVWLPYGMAGDTGPVATDGHVDGVAHYVAPGKVLLLVPEDPNDEDYDTGHANADRLAGERDAKGRTIEAIRLIGADGANAYANCYVANGVVIAPVVGHPNDDAGIVMLKEAFPDREVVGLPSATIAFGGGGPHCITQQVPAGAGT